MGNQSSLATTDEPYVYVQPMTPCPRGGRGLDPAKPSSLTVDDGLWSDLRDRVDPLARRLNQGYLVGNLLFSAAIVAYVVVSVAEPMSFRYWPIVSFHVVLALYFAFAIGTIGRNQRIDEQIFDVVSDMKPRFVTRGYDIRYLTKHTGYCKPKGAQVERVIVFPATGSDAPSAELAVSGPISKAEAVPVTILRHTSDVVASSAQESADALPVDQSVTDQMMADLSRPL